MRILAINAGSASVKFAVVESEGEQVVLRGAIEDFSEHGSWLRIEGDRSRDEAWAAANPAAAAASVPEAVSPQGAQLDAVGHRIAHGGADFGIAARLDETALTALETVSALAPLHNPLSLAGVTAARRAWPDLPQYGVFDTGFHRTLPSEARDYAVPERWRQAGLRRYGFHGLAHEFAANAAARLLGRAPRELRLINCHLGGGASVCAIAGGRSIDTSMGLTPLEGLIMQTRPGDLDPGAAGFVRRAFGLDLDAFETALNRESGMMALAGETDMRVIIRRAQAGDPAAIVALDAYAYRAAKYAGAYAVALDGFDALSFTGGIGENAAEIRRRVCSRLSVLGVDLDADLNARARVRAGEAVDLSAPRSPIRTLVIGVDEQRVVARHAAALAQADCLVRSA